MPLQISDIQSTIKKEMNLKLSHTMVRKYLTQELNVSYRKLRPVLYLYNNLKSKLERQLAASVYIDYLETERRIINIDESIITLTEHQKRGWLVKGVKNKATLPQRPGQLNIIAGVSNFGELFFTINKGKKTPTCSCCL